MAQILIIDDEAGIRKLLRLILRKILSRKLLRA